MEFTVLNVIQMPDEMEKFSLGMAQGSCLCAEIDPSDKPCLTCAAREYLQVFECPRCDHLVSWDNGCLDETPALCDDCAMAIQRLWDIDP